MSAWSFQRSVRKGRTVWYLGIGAHLMEGRFIQVEIETVYIEKLRAREKK